MQSGFSDRVREAAEVRTYVHGARLHSCLSYPCQRHSDTFGLEILESQDAASRSTANGDPIDYVTSDPRQRSLHFRHDPTSGLALVAVWLAVGRRSNPWAQTDRQVTCSACSLQRACRRRRPSTLPRPAQRSRASSATSALFTATSTHAATGRRGRPLSLSWRRARALSPTPLLQTAFQFLSAPTAQTASSPSAPSARYSTRSAYALSAAKR